MSGGAYITTSWDDGHPLDFRVADLLTKYALRGTFYVPKASDRVTMSASRVRDLSTSFEIGAHTLHHVVLTSVPAKKAWAEIAGSKSWVEETTGSACSSFCPPTGRYARRHAEMVAQAGFLGLRSAELMSVDFPRRLEGIVVMPTTVQAYPHPFSAFVKNATKRGAFANLWRFVLHGRSADWPELARAVMATVLRQGGVFHLWGHSWELQEQDQWHRLEAVLALLGQHTRYAAPVSNRELCEQSLRCQPSFSKKQILSA